MRPSPRSRAVTAVRSAGRRPAAALLVIGLLGLLVAPAEASVTATAFRAEQSDECERVIGDLRDAVAGLPNKSAQPGTVAAEERTGRARQLFTEADNQHPSCRSDIEGLGFDLAAAARRQVTVKGTPFWGPVGWMWNNVYYRVFNANNVMMALFGWALLLSPLILALSAYWVLRGSRGAFHRPFVPEHLRTDT